MDHWRTHSRTYFEIFAVLVLMISGLAYIVRLQTDLSRSSAKERQLENELNQERGRFAALGSQQGAPRPPVLLSLKTEPEFREVPGGKQQQPQQIKLVPEYDQRISVTLSLEGAPSGLYEVRLETAEGAQIWTATLRPLIFSPSRAELAFDMPSQGITSADYAFVVSPRPRKAGDEYHYYFRALVATSTR